MRSFRPAPPDSPHLVESGSRGLRDDFRRDPPQLHGLLRRARACRRALGVARALGARPVGAAHDRRHAAVQAVLPGRGEAARASSDVHPALLPRGRHRRGRLDRPPPHVLPDDGQLLVRRLLQAGRGGDGLRALDGRWGLDPERIWATVYEGDDQLGPDDVARELWLGQGIPAEPHRRARRGQLLEGGADRAVRPVLGALLRPRRAARLRPAPTARRGATAIASSSSGTSSSWSSTAETTAP